MKRILLFLIFSWVAGTLLVHAMGMEEHEGYSSFEPYPYPPVLSTAIDNLPQGYDTILLGDETFYYFKGTFYKKIIQDAKYTMVAPPIGAVVYDLPSNYQYMFIDGKALYVSGGVYYKKELNGYKVIYPPQGI